jgi:hypothetical protein
MASSVTGYSNAEVTAAAAALVQGSGTTAVDSLGPVDIAAKFQEAVDLVTTTLVSDPNAIFYLLYLDASSILDDLVAVMNSAQDLLVAVSEIAGITRSITHTTLLGDAAGALIEIDAILSKDAAVQRASYDRFIRAVDSFRDVSLAPNIILPGSVAVVHRSHPEAVQTVYRQLLSLRTAYPATFQRIQGLGIYLANFLELELRKAAAMTTVTQARQSLTDMQSMFEDAGTTDAYKVSQARVAYLQLAAAKATVSGVRLLADPSLPKVDATPGSGLALFKNLPVSYYDDVNHPFIPQDATAVGKIAGPWKITSANDQLAVAANGQPAAVFSLPTVVWPTVLSGGGTTEYTFVNTTAATLAGSSSGPFVIPDSPGNVFTVIVDGVVYSGLLTAGTRGTGDVISDILAISGLSSVLTVVAGGSGNIVLTTVQQGSTAGIIVRTLGSVLGFEGSLAYAAGTDYNRMLLINGDRLVELPAGTLSTADVAVAITSAFSDGEFVATAHTDDKRISLQRNGQLKFKMSLPLVGGGYAGHTREELSRCYALLGFQDGQIGQTAPITAQQLAEFLNADPVFRALNVVASVSRGVTTTNGDLLDVTGLACTVLGADSVSFPAADIPAAFIQNYATGTDVLSVHIKTGYNDGVCRMSSMLSHDSASVHMRVDAPFPLDSAQAPTAYAIEKDTLQITSTAWSTPGVLTSQLVISGSAAGSLGLAGTFYGSTNGVLFFPTSSAIPAQLSEQFYKAAVNLATYGVKKSDLLWRPDPSDLGQPGVTLFTVAGIFAEPDAPGSGNKVLALDLPGISLRPMTGPDLGWVVYSYEAFEYKYFIERAYPQYYAYMQQAQARPYSTGSTAELDRVLNPLLANPNPSTGQINDARAAVTAFISVVRAAIVVCSAVIANKVDRVDAALGMLQERGFDLAYKALSTGDLIGFLAMDKDDASSSAAMLKAARSVVQSDVPISKTTDSADIVRTHQTTAYSPDASYDYADVSNEDPVSLIGAGATIDSVDPAADQVTGKTLSG